MQSNINLSTLYANSWSAGKRFDEAVDAITYVVLTKGATLPLASSALASTERPVPYSTPGEAYSITPDWRWTEDKTLIIRSLVREIGIRYQSILPSAFFEAIEAVLEVFQSVNNSDPNVLEGLAVDTELLFVGAFLLIARAYYEPRFSTRELDFITGSRYGDYLQPSPWLEALKDALGLEQEEADAEGLVRARRGIIADCRAMLDEYRVLVTEERRAFGIPMSQDEKSETAPLPVSQEPVNHRFIDEEEVDPSLAALAYQLWAEAQAAEAEAVSISEGRHPSQEPTPSRALSSSRIPRSTSRLARPPSVPAASSSTASNNEPISTVNQDIPPADSMVFGLPQPASTVESLAALLAEGPEDWHEQLTEMKLMIDNVHSSLHDALSRKSDRPPPSTTSALPSSGSVATTRIGLGITSALPTSNSLASMAGSVRIDVIAPTPLLPVSVSVPEWLAAAQPSSFLSNGPSDLSSSNGSIVQPSSNPSASSDLSTLTLVGEGYTIHVKPKSALPTSRPSASGSTTDWLAFCRGKFSRSFSSASSATTLSEDSAGWLADGSTTSSLALHRVPNGPSASSSLAASDPPSDHSSVSGAAPASTQSKFGAFVRRLRLRRGQDGLAVPSTTGSVAHPSSSRTPSSVLSPVPERLDDWNVVVYLPEPTTESARSKPGWMQKLGSTKGWFVKGAKAQMAERVVRV